MSATVLTSAITIFQANDVGQVRRGDFENAAISFRGDAMQASGRYVKRGTDHEGNWVEGAFVIAGFEFAITRLEEERFFLHAMIL